MNVELLPEVQSDIRGAVAYYRTHTSGLASSFMNNVAQSLLQLEAFPESGAGVARTSDKIIRRLLVKNFPYGIFYYTNEETVFVLSVAHVHRKPRDWNA
jgi:plasmid stabilization system protein ParE